MKLRQLLLPPALQQDWGDVQSHRSVTGTELFGDLLLVVACSNINSVLDKDRGIFSFALFFLYFSCFWSLWGSLTSLQSRFKLEGLLQDVLVLLHLLCVLSLIMHCGDIKLYRRFAVSYAAVHVTIILLYLPILGIPRARAAAAVYISAHVIPAVLGMCCVFVSSYWFMWVMYAAVGLHMCSMYMPSVLNKGFRIPIHVDHFAERHGCVIMIFLGEILVDLALKPTPHTVEQYAALGLGATVAWSLHMIYYHACPDQHYHALRLSAMRGLSWGLLHWVLGTTLLMTGAGIGLLVNEGDHLARPAVWMTCCAYGMALECIAGIRGCHFLRTAFIPADPMVHKVVVGWWVMAFGWPVVVLFLPLAGTWIPPLAYLACLAAHGLMYNVFETVISTYLATQPKWMQLFEFFNAHTGSGAAHQRPDQEDALRTHLLSGEGVTD